MNVRPEAMKAGGAALAALAIASAPAFAADSEPIGIRWNCTQERDVYFHVNCVPQRARADAPPDAAALPAPAAGTADMRPVAARGTAEVFSTRAWRIPLYTQSQNPASVADLLKEVLCGSVPGCDVAYADGPDKPL